MTCRWPIGPLLERTKLTGHGLRKEAHIHTTIYNTAAEHGLTDRQADTWAIRCGKHPSQVWGPAWDEAGLSELDRVFLNNGWRPAWLWLEARRSVVAPRELSSPGATVPAMDEERAA